MLWSTWGLLLVGVVGANLVCSCLIAAVQLRKPSLLAILLVLLPGIWVVWSKVGDALCENAATDAELPSFFAGHPQRLPWIGVVFGVLYSLIGTSLVLSERHSAEVDYRAAVPVLEVQRVLVGLAKNEGQRGINIKITARKPSNFTAERAVLQIGGDAFWKRLEAGPNSWAIRQGRWMYLPLEVVPNLVAAWKAFPTNTQQAELAFELGTGAVAGVPHATILDFLRTRLGPDSPPFYLEFVAPEKQVLLARIHLTATALLRALERTGPGSSQSLVELDPAAGQAEADTEAEIEVKEG